MNETREMSVEENVGESENTVSQPENPVEDNSKRGFRRKAWDYLEKNKLVNFPKPVYGRIPNFKGAEKAAAKLLELEEFKVAKSVEVNHDKTLEPARILVIENNKILYVPVPQLEEGILKKISFCDQDKPENLKQTVTRWGIGTLGKPVDFQDVLHIDLVVVGSVAVSKEGHRIGKGKGFADLEFAILKEMKAVDDNTTIITTVHDSQVFDSFPGDLMQKHDVPVDYILTPTQVIKVEKKLPRPEGVYWNLLSQRRLELMPILQKIKKVHSSQGRDTSLKEVDTDIENEDKKKQTKAKKLTHPQPKPENEEKNGIIDTTNNERPRRRRFFKRSSSTNVTKENEDPVNQENQVKQENQVNQENNATPSKKKKKQRQNRKNTRKLHLDFSLVVSNIDRNVRLRHLKDALIDRGVKPATITWRGCKGFCYLHYLKPPKKEDEKVAEEKSFAVDTVIEIIQALKLNPQCPNLTVKVMEPITRIETTDVTAV